MCVGPLVRTHAEITTEGDMNGFVNFKLNSASSKSSPSWRALFLDAWFPSDKIERSGGLFGEVDLLPTAVLVRPPASALKTMLLLALGHLATPKGKAFLMPYASIRNLNMIETKTFIGTKIPVIELQFLDQTNVLQTLAFAPCEGKLKVKYKSEEFLEQLKTRVSGSRPESSEIG